MRKWILHFSFYFYNMYICWSGIWTIYPNTKPSYYQVCTDVWSTKKNANEKRRRKLHPILTLEVTLDKQIYTIEYMSMDITWPSSIYIYKHNISVSPYVYIWNENDTHTHTHTRLHCVFNANKNWSCIRGIRNY